MSRSRLIFAAAVLILTGWIQWSFWTSMESAERTSTQGRLTGNPAASSNAVRPTAPKISQGDLVTFEHEGQTMTVNLAQVRRSHALLVRQPPASPDITTGGAPDPDFNFLSWPKRESRGEETIKTRKCWIIDFTNPKHAGPHFLVRLYVDQKLGALMRTQAYDWSGKRVLDYTVTAGKKVNGELTVARAEARHYEPGSKRIAQEVEYRLP